MRRIAIAVPAALLLITAAGCGDDAGSAGAPTPTMMPGGLGRVTRVVDGDTLRVRMAAGPSERVRLIGIDAPELSGTRTGSAQCGGAQARRALAEATPPGSSVVLQFDPTQDRRDRFGRLLAYVFPDGEEPTAQARLLLDGWARVYVYDRNPFVRVEEFRAAAARARDHGAGVWASCGGRFDRPVS